MSWVWTDCADLSSKVSSCRGGGGGEQAGCGFSPWKPDMMKFWKRWSSCCLYFLEPWCFRQCMDGAWEILPAKQVSCAWFALREVWCQAIYLPALSFPGMQSHWTLNSCWRYGFGPPTLSWFLLSWLHLRVSFYLATGSFPKLEVQFACDPCVVALSLLEFSLCCSSAEQGNNDILSFLQVEYTCRTYHVLQRPYSRCSTVCDILGFYLRMWL